MHFTIIYVFNVGRVCFSLSLAVMRVTVCCECLRVVQEGGGGGGGCQEVTMVVDGRGRR